MNLVQEVARDRRGNVRMECACSAGWWVFLKPSGKLRRNYLFTRDRCPDCGARFVQTSPAQ